LKWRDVGFGWWRTQLGRRGHDRQGWGNVGVFFPACVAMVVAMAVVMTVAVVVAMAMVVAVVIVLF
jgi:hypothetical protein